MDWLLGKFSLPYTGDDPDAYAVWLTADHVAPYVDSVFVGVDHFFPATHTLPPERYLASETFIRRYANRWPTYLTLNARLPRSITNHAALAKRLVTDELVELMASSGVTGAIVSDPNIAQTLLQRLPELKIDASIDAEDALGDVWANIPLRAYNIRRDDAYRLSRVRWLREHVPSGTMLKLMPNGTCVRMCPFTHHHLDLNAELAIGELSEEAGITEAKRMANVLGLTEASYTAHAKTAIVLPRWLRRYEGLVEIIKLDGRSMNIPWLDRCLRAYVTGDDDGLLLTDLLPDSPCCLIDDAKLHGRFHELASYPVAWLDDYMASCEAMCDGCDRCAALARRIAKADALRRRILNVG